MLSIDARKNPEQYNKVGPFLNLGFVAGYLRGFNSKTRTGLIQQTENLNQSVPFVIAEGDALPARFMDGSPISLVGHVYGRRVGEDQVAILKAIGVDYANVLEIDPTIALSRIRKSAPPADARVDETFQPFRVGRDEVSSSANNVRLAGIITDLQLRSQTESESGRLLLMLRQHEKGETDIPVRFYGALAARVAETVNIGGAVQIAGSLYVDVKRTGETDEDGKSRVRKLPYVLSKLVPMVVDERVMTDVPDWAVRLIEATKSEGRMRRRRRAAAELAPAAGGTDSAG